MAVLRNKKGFTRKRDWVQKKYVEMGGHKIRLLLLIRIGEEDLADRYTQLESTTTWSALRRTRFNEFEDELRIGKYSEENCEAEIIDEEREIR